MNRREGFTLVELLVAMSLLVVMGGLILRLVDRSFALYEEGDRKGELYDLGLGVLERMEQDLMALAAPPEGRLLFECNGGGAGFAMRLVRTIPGGEQRHFVLRKSATEAIVPIDEGGDEDEGPPVFVGTDPGPEGRGLIPPPTGVMEVCYALLQEPGDPDGMLTLYRGERAPADGGFFASSRAEDLTEDWIRANLQPIAGGILGLWVLAVTGPEGDLGTEEAALGGRTRSGSFLNAWDSSRSSLSQEVFSPPPSGPGGRSVALPSRLRLVVHVGRAWAPEARLIAPLRAKAPVMDVTRTRMLPDAQSTERMVKLRGEWVEVVELGTSEARLARGRRGSGKSWDHPIGTPVFAGKTFRKTIEVAVAPPLTTGDG